MGYRTDTRAELVLEDMEGAVVTVTTGVPLSALREFDLAPDLAGEWAVFLAHARPEWDLEDAAGPIPAEQDALERLPLWASRGMLRAWRTAAVNPPGPLPRQSSEATASAA